MTLNSDGTLTLGAITLTAEQVKAVKEAQLPEWSRQEVIEFRFNPATREDKEYHEIHPDGLINDLIPRACSCPEVYEECMGQGYIFAPTPELIEECKRILEGFDWLPKKGDEYAWYRKDNGKIGTEPAQSDYGVTWLKNYIFAPTLAQLKPLVAKWEAQQKAKEFKLSVYDEMKQTARAIEDQAILFETRFSVISNLIKDIVSELERLDKRGGQSA